MAKQSDSHGSVTASKKSSGMEKMPDFLAMHYCELFKWARFILDQKVGEHRGPLFDFPKISDSMV